MIFEESYRVGGLLYMPANKQGMAKKLVYRKIPALTSAALCLEDSIADEFLEQAEDDLARSLEEILKLRETADQEQPMLFIRPRSPRHLEELHRKLGSLTDAIDGYILPKFDLTNADTYCDLIPHLPGKRFYCMPILESRQIADIATRNQALYAIRSKLDTIASHVLNIRVGGNDFCNLYGIRRSVNQNIWQIGVVRDILVDIYNVFADDYVVSGPVWEYFDNHQGSEWERGLRNELELDRLNGFIGKTAIHPSQLPHIQQSLKVSRQDWQDAMRILNWNHTALAVGHGEGRMNEVKCHSRWAKKIAMLGRIYGVSGEETEDAHLV